MIKGPLLAHPPMQTGEGEWVMPYIPLGGLFPTLLCLGSWFTFVYLQLNWVKQAASHVGDLEHIHFILLSQIPTLRETTAVQI